MRVRVIPKAQLTEAQLAHVNARIDAPIHANDRGALSGWAPGMPKPSLYAIVLVKSGLPIGTLYAAGFPNEIDVAWWMDSDYRGQGYGTEAVEQLADVLIASGVTGVGNIRVDTFGGQYEDQSKKLVKRFRDRFGRSG